MVQSPSGCCVCACPPPICKENSCRALAIGIRCWPASGLLTSYAPRSACHSLTTARPGVPLSQAELPHTTRMMMACDSLHTRPGRCCGLWPCALGLIYALAALRLAHGLEFEMQTQMKCVYEEINTNVIVVGEYQAYHKDHADLQQFVDVKVRQPLTPGDVLPGGQSVPRASLARTHARRTGTCGRFCVLACRAPCVTMAAPPPPPPLRWRIRT